MTKAVMGKTSFKIQRRLGVELPGLGKAGALARRPYGPGAHGMKRKKLSDYMVRLAEKQKLMFHYGLREKYLVNQVKKSKKDKSHSWVDTLVTTLERRLDNIVFRSGWAPSMGSARQLVSHGHVLVNGNKVNIPSYVVKIEDKISLKEIALQNGSYLQAKARPRLATIPAYLDKLGASSREEVTIKSMPLPEDIPFPFEKRLVIEYYWKV
jgi:small subunit ribosomal protein S4